MVIPSRRKKELWAQPLPKVKHKIQNDIHKLKASIQKNNEAYSNYELSKEKLNVMSKNSATYFLQVTKAWDHASKKQRESILTDFVKYNRFRNCPELLEKELLNGGSLFFTRISTWFRLSYMLEDTDLSLLLHSMGIFLLSTKSNNLKFINEFVEVGCILTVIEVLNLSFATEESKVAALQLIATFAKAGLAYKEILCECRVIDHLIECLTGARSTVLTIPLKDTLVMIGLDNLRFIAPIYKSMLTTFNSSTSGVIAQKISGQVIRSLLPQIGSIHLSVIEAVIALLKSPFESTQYEAYEILKDISKRQSTQSNLIRMFTTIIKNIIEDTKEPAASGTGLKGDSKGINSAFTNNKEAKNDTSDKNNDQSTKDAGSTNGDKDPKNKNKNENTNASSINRTIQEIFYAAKMQQAYSAKLLGVMAAREPYLAKEMLDLQVVNGLLSLIANMNHRPSQKAATETLLFFVDTFEHVAKQIQIQIGFEFYNMLQRRPDTFHIELTPIQIYNLRQNKTVIETDSQEFEKLEEEQFGSASGEDEEDKEEGDGDEEGGDGEENEEVEINDFDENGLHENKSRRGSAVHALKDDGSENKDGNNNESEGNNCSPDSDLIDSRRKSRRKSIVRGQRRSFLGGPKGANQFLSTGQGIRMPSFSSEDGSEIDLSEIKQKKLSFAFKEKHGIYVPVAKASSNKLLPHYKFTEKVTTTMEQEIQNEMIKLKEQFATSGVNVSTANLLDDKFNLKELESSIKKIVSHTTGTNATLGAGFFTNNMQQTISSNNSKSTSAAATGTCESSSNRSSPNSKAK